MCRSTVFLLDLHTIHLNKEKAWNFLAPDRKYLQVRSHDLVTITYNIYDVAKQNFSTIR